MEINFEELKQELQEREQILNVQYTEQEKEEYCKAYEAIWNQDHSNNSVWFVLGKWKNIIEEANAPIEECYKMIEKFKDEDSEYDVWVMQDVLELLQISTNLTVVDLVREKVSNNTLLPVSSNPEDFNKDTWNKKAYGVHRHKGQVFYNEGIVFVEKENNACFRGNRLFDNSKGLVFSSCVHITKPVFLKTFYVDVIDSGEETIIKDINQFTDALSYYGIPLQYDDVNNMYTIFHYSYPDGTIAAKGNKAILKSWSPELQDYVGYIVLEGNVYFLEVDDMLIPLNLEGYELRRA